jgi:hypothetical protein
MEKFYCDFIQAYGATEFGGFSSYLLPENHVFDDSDTKFGGLALSVVKRFWLNS